MITAEDVGKMPDKNVADSLQRLPGVSVAAAGGGEGSFGENDRVALRGTAFGLTLTTLNGHSVSSGDWFADNIIGGGRSVSYSLFPRHQSLPASFGANANYTSRRASRSPCSNRRQWA